MTAVSAGRDVGGRVPAPRRVAGAVRPAGPTALVARAALVALVALAGSAIVVGAVAVVGATWEPLSDWASLVVRVSQVGTADTPLVGPYSFHGFAHPGPLLYWLAAPPFRLSGGDPRTLLWTGAAVNVASVAGLAAVAWRRGGPPLVVGVAALTALLVHGFGPRVVVDLWNPYVALLPFLLAAVLLWDLALGDDRGGRRALVPLVVAASFAMQAHLAFVPLVAVAALWCAWWVRRDGPGAWRPGAWWPAARPALVVGAVLWAGPLVDALVGSHNPVRVARGVGSPVGTVGLVDAVGLVGGYVRPDGYWWRGDGPSRYVVAHAADALAVPLLALALAGAAGLARRRGLRDAEALATLALALLVATVPAVSQLVAPTDDYLGEWVKVTGGLAWGALAWTGWRLLAVSPARAAGPARVGAGVATVAVVVVAATGTWGPAARLGTPPGDEAGVAAALREAVGRELDPALLYRVEVVGDARAHHAGLIRVLLDAGLTVATGDGAAGQKWGPSRRWAEGDPVDVTLTFAVDVPRRPSARAARCATDPDLHRVFATGGLTETARDQLDDLARRSATGAGDLSAADGDRMRRLAQRDVRITLYAGDHVCGGAAPDEAP